MKKLPVFVGFALFLSACSLPGNPFSPVQNVTFSPNAQKQIDSGAIVQEGDTVAVNYTGKFEDGEVFDSSIKEEAMKKKDYDPVTMSGRTYEPFTVNVIPDGGAIPGFWKAIVGMKVGEKKTVTIKPEDAYGTDWIPQNDAIVDKKIFAAKVEKTIPRSETLDTIQMKVPLKVLEEQGRAPKLGDILENDQGVKAKVVAINATDVSLEIDNSNNPFHGKKLVVGTVIVSEGTSGKITKVTKNEITLLIDNANPSSNPFIGKKLEVGLEGVYQERQKIKIAKIDGDQVTLQVSQKNEHPLANKTLVFDLEVMEIKSSASSAK